MGVSFSFETLSIQQITFQSSYTILNFFGDFAYDSCVIVFNQRRGMIGTLMGLDVIKVAMAVPTSYFAYKFRACWPLEEVFNG